MIVIVKSGPDTQEGKRGVKTARDLAADLVLIQNAVFFAEKERLEGFCGTAYALDEDMRLRGVSSPDKGIKAIGYGALIDLMGEKTVGAF